MSLRFELTPPTAPADHRRADIACFIGHVARRPGVPLPAALREQLAAAGWVHGVWARPAAQLETLDNLPVVLDGWDQFDTLFAWEGRPVEADGRRRCATYLGAALRSFFAHGGRRAIVIRVGDPWPLLEDAAVRTAQRRPRLRRLLPDYARLEAPITPFAPGDPATWQGIQHLYGRREASLVLLPDLADACAVAPPVPAPAPLPPVPPEGFTECSVDEAPEPDTSLADIPPPRLDQGGYAAWRVAIEAARHFLDRQMGPRETMLVTSLPLPHVTASRIEGGGRVYAQADTLAWLERMGVLAGALAGDRPAEALVQLAWPWLALRAGGDLPAGLEPPEGTLAGLIAASAVERGCHRSVAGEFSRPRLRDLVRAEPMPAWDLAEDAPDARLARRVCLFAPQPDGWALQSDVTTLAAGACRFGGAGRLLGNLLRACRVAGESVVFEPNGERTWAQLAATLNDVLFAYWRAGAFSGASPAEAWSLRCDGMTRNDLDSGRLIVHLTVWPAMSIERITVVLTLGSGADGLREAA
ncbi:MAG TPA: hypothetical protein PKH69_02955 [Thiobacillaceae bacterium]|nr:hypothetical protein [Thiobacillaceae bacterium]HNU63046.1 hypothetical protein [Thiobacillaceae bacterium]